jgi:uncharacterized protein (DUF58 family)
LIYPSGRCVWAGVIGVVPAFLVALALPSVWYAGLLWMCLLLGFLAVDASAGPGRAALTAGLQSVPQVGIGGQFPVFVTAHFAGRWPSRIEARLAHDDRLVPVGEAGGALQPTPEGGGLELRFRAVRRGMASLDRLWLRWPGPFGLTWKQVALPMDNKVSVLPNIAGVREDAISLLQRDAQAEGMEQRRSGQGREFESLKDYQPGMGRRMIDWKRSARHGKLVAREFRVEQNNNIVLALDSGRLMCEPVDGVAKIDRAVTAALLTAFVALKGGDTVGLFSFDARPRVVGKAVRGSGGFAMVQRRAAEIDYSSEETNFTLALTVLASQLDRRSLVVVFTDFVDPISAELMLRSVGRLTERHLVLFMLMKDEELETLSDTRPSTGEDVARSVIAGGLLREREVVIARLRRLGVHVVEADHRRLGPELVQHYLELKRENLL